MSKRKFEELGNRITSSELQTSREESREQRKLDNILDYGKGVLSKALKVARGSERQKLGRRQKDVKEKKDDEGMARLGAEVAALKNIDLPSTAELYLYKTLARMKSISSTQTLPQVVISKAQASSPFQDPAYVNVTARLYKSSSVRAAMAEILGLIREALEVPNVDGKHRSKRRPRKADYNAMLASNGSADTIKKNKNTKANHMHKETSTTIEHAVEDGGDDIDHRQYDSRLADDTVSDGDPSDECSTSGNLANALVRASICISQDKRTEAVAQSHSQDLTSKSSSVRQQSPRISTKALRNTRPATTFLPSLMMGGYISGSESDFTDEEGASLAPRRNRMGQQARRALWEKKYGSKANHLERQNKNRDHGWDPRRGAQPSHGKDTFRGREKKNKGIPGNRDQRQASGSKSNSVKNRDLLDKPPVAGLHPSWEAARKLKEQKQTVAFHGKKIVFD